MEAVINDLNNNISFDDFLKKYPKTKVDSNLLVVKYKYKNSDKKDVVLFYTIDGSHRVTIEEKPEVYDQSVNGKWIFDHSGTEDISVPFLWGYFFTSEFKNQPIPEVYARMIQYADCLVE